MKREKCDVLGKWMGRAKADRLLRSTIILKSTISEDREFDLVYVSNIH